MRFLLVLIFVFGGIDLKAQNLVPNHSFEQHSCCPWSLGVFGICVNEWYNPTTSFPDYLNACANGTNGHGVPTNSRGYQQARTGEAYAGLSLFTDPAAPVTPNFRKYIAAKLTEPLEADTAYCVEFFASLCGGLWNLCAVSNLGLYLSVDSVYDNQKDTLSYAPQIQNDPNMLLQDTLNWMRIGGTYTAQGGERFIVIGNFLPNDQTNAINVPDNEAYYYIDDVSVERCSHVGLSANALVADQTELQLYPNPAADVIRYQSPEPAVLVVIHDVAGRKTKVLATNPIDVSHLSQGVYVLEVIAAHQRYRQRFVKQ